MNKNNDFKTEEYKDISPKNRYDNNSHNPSNSSQSRRPSDLPGAYSEVYGVNHFHVDSGAQDSAYFSDPDADMKIYPDGLNVSHNAEAEHNLEAGNEFPFVALAGINSTFAGGVSMGAPYSTAPLFGAFATQAITDNTEKYEESNTPKPSEQDIEEGRDWIEENQK